MFEEMVRERCSPPARGASGEESGEECGEEPVDESMFIMDPRPKESSEVTELARGMPPRRAGGEGEEPARLGRCVPGSPVRR